MEKSQNVRTKNAFTPKNYVNFYRLNFETQFELYEILHPFVSNESSIKEIGLVLNVL